MNTTTTKAPRVKWKVQQRYDIWHPRGWPDAEYSDGSVAASIHCDDAYVPSNVKSGNHAPLTVCFADYSVTPWKWMRLTKRAATLAEAKDLFASFLARHHEKFARKMSSDKQD